MWENIPPPGAAPQIHYLCQGTLKLFWWLIVAQSPAKTLTIDVSFILAAPLSNPRSPKPLSLATQLSVSSLWQDPIEREHICVCVCVFLLLYSGLVQMHV